MIGMDDMWTPLQFDAAVSLFGMHVENQLNRFDPKTGKALYKLEHLLDDTPKNSLASLKGHQGVIIRLKGE